MLAKLVLIRIDVHLIMHHEQQRWWWRNDYILSKVNCIDYWSVHRL